jgi:hypothetical protein
MVEHKQRPEEVLFERADDEPVDVNNTISLNDIHSNISLTTPYTYTSTTFGTNFPNAIWTSSGTNSAPWFTTSPNNPIGTSAKIQLNGEGADVEVNGWSLVDAVKRIEQRLNLFQPNPKLESEWNELFELGRKYRELEQQIKDKQATWDRLKAMPPPEID